MDGDNAVGFCQYYDCFDAQELEDWYCVSKRGEAFSIDYLIGAEHYLKKGFGRQIVRLLTEIIKAIKHDAQIIVQPEPENIASVQVLLANGYRYDPAKGYYFKK